MTINAFDYDGVVSLGITPGPNDVIISGRCFDEAPEINKKLRERGIFNAIYFNPISYELRGDHTEACRKISGHHKVAIVCMLKINGITVKNFFEDDNIQAKIIKKVHKDVNIVMVTSNLVEL